ncbi:MAG: glycosyltransferase, partial [Tepidiformaceae bacterium]
MPAAQGTLLCVANYPANTGYAWDFLEGLYAAVADRVVASGITTFVAYPLIEVAPKTLAASVARPVTLDVSLRSLVSLWTVGAFIHRHRVRVVYFTDQPVFSTAYWWLRLMGVRHIIVYDHTSGARTPPRGVKYALKWLVCRLPGLAADRVIAVSDYVAERHRTVSLVPFGRVTRVWNGVQVPPDGAGTQAVRESLGVAADRPLVVCCGRAAPEKGVECLLRAFDRVITRLSPGG